MVKSLVIMLNSPDNIEGTSPKEQKMEKFIAKLPTNSEIVRQGVESFKKVTQKLPDDLKTIFLESVQIQACFIGITPEAGSENDTPLEDLPKEQLTEVIEIIAQEAPDMEIIQNGHSIINLKACQQVMTNYPQYFPQEAVDNPKGWLINNFSKSLSPDDGITEIRWGLLSGYSLTSVLNFCQPGENKEGIKVSNKYDTVWYTSGTPDRDIEYLRQLDEIFDKSGIKEIVAGDQGQQSADKIYEVSND